jgi:hypothetical protein
MANTVIQKNVLVLDIMLNGSFICQMKMPHCPLFPVDEREVNKFVTDRKPSLKGKAFKVEFSNAAPLFRGDANVIL